MYFYIGGLVLLYGLLMVHDVFVSVCFPPALFCCSQFFGSFFVVFENHVAFIRSSKGVKDCGARFTDNIWPGPLYGFLEL